MDRKVQIFCRNKGIKDISGYKKMIGADEDYFSTICDPTNIQ